MPCDILRQPTNKSKVNSELSETPLLSALQSRCVYGLRALSWEIPEDFFFFGKDEGGGGGVGVKNLGGRVEVR